MNDVKLTVGYDQVIIVNFIVTILFRIFSNQNKQEETGQWICLLLVMDLSLIDDKRISYQNDWLHKISVKIVLTK